MSSICSDIFKINKYKLKNGEKHKSYNYRSITLFNIGIIAEFWFISW